MIRFKSIRTTLTVWYAFCLAATLLIFAVGARFAMQVSLQNALDQTLLVRLGDVGDFLKQETTLDYQSLLDELGEQAMLGLGGGQVELWDGSGHLLFRSTRLRPGQIGVERPVVSSGATEVRYMSTGKGKDMYRVAFQTPVINGKSYTVRAGEPMYEFQQAVELFDGLLLYGSPTLLILASLGGFLVSKRALAPVDRITRDAHAISITSLSKRLEVPPARDEIRRLAETLNAMLKRIDDAVQRMAQFTADASHELRTPLTLIQTASEFCLRGDRSREELLDAMRQIRHETGRTTRLVNDLLALARADTGAEMLAPYPIDIAQVIQDVGFQTQTLAERKRITVVVTAPDSPILIDSDEEALTRLLLILADNAVKYTNDGGRISLELRTTQDGLEIKLTDTGIGIAPEHLDRIWDRFWRADKVRSRGSGGVGLGLSIAHSIAQRLGAGLTVNSQLGRGSEFIVRLNTTNAAAGQDRTLSVSS